MQNQKIIIDETQRSISLHTGCRHVFKLHGRLIINIMFDPEAKESGDDRFILRSDDGSYESVQTVADDKIRGDDYCTLIFRGLSNNKSYTLIHDEGPERPKYTIFYGFTLDELSSDEPIEEEPEALQDSINWWWEQEEFSDGRRDEQVENVLGTEDTFMENDIDKVVKK